MSNKFRKIMRVLVYCILFAIIICFANYMLNDLNKRYNDKNEIKKMRIEKKNAW